MHLHNADVVKKFIFRYLGVPLTDGLWNILLNITNKDIFNKIIELNKFLNNVCIISVNSSNRQGTVSSLILVPIRSGLRGFCLFILVNSKWTISKKNPLRYHALPMHLCTVINQILVSD